MPTPKNLILPDPDTLNQVEYGKFLLANLAAKRAKQIKEGAPPLVRIESNHPLSIALAEIAQGKIKPLLGCPPWRTTRTTTMVCRSAPWWMTTKSWKTTKTLWKWTKWMKMPLSAA